MTSSQNFFSSFEASPTPHILMGNNTIMTVCGKGSVDIDDGTFHNVLCVPSLSSNLISIYQITHSGTWKIVEFHMIQYLSEIVRQVVLLLQG